MMQQVQSSEPSSRTAGASAPSCRLCAAPLRHTFVDLGMSPLANSFLTAEQLEEKEPFYPLHVLVCGSCFLVQLEEFERPEKIFSDYVYFSSFSPSWVRHAKNYTEQMARRFGIDGNKLVVEIASNDGYLLQHFVADGVPVLGIEPAANVAAEARKKNVPTLVEFFGSELAKRLAAEGKRADLLLGNNVLAHVPALRDFVAGLGILLKPQGVITMEFPHLLSLIQQNQFDTIYHEHFSYFSLAVVERLFREHGLVIFDVEELPTHGGSLRIFARHGSDASKPVTAAIERLKEKERSAGLESMTAYEAFAARVKECKRALVEFVKQVKRGGKKIAGYGAPAKGNTLLNYCGIGRDLLDYTVDVSPHKQGRYLPGTHIPVYAPEKLWETRPDYVLILPWNLRDEIMPANSSIHEWGGKFVTPIPSVEVLG